MRAIGLLISLCAACSIQAQEHLWKVSRPIPTYFQSRPEAKAPKSYESESVRKYAADWINRRATSKSWKAGKWEFLGMLDGRPADELPGGSYQVYRLKFEKSPDLGKQYQSDMLFYGQGKELIWPPEQWARDKAPPGQNNAAVLNREARK